MESFGQATEQWISGVSDAISEGSFRAWAIGEAWTAASIFMPVYETATSISPLTSRMLRMYLRGTQPDADLIREVASEIALSSTFGRLATATRNAIDQEVRSRRRLLDQAEVDSVARRIIHLGYRDSQTGNAMYFFNSDRGLQGVIGGIHDLRVQSTSLTGSSYTIQVVIRDRYDFNNNQNVTGNNNLAEYVRFRERLDNHIRRREYREFLLAYHRSLYLADPIIRSRTFAAFMYAIERNGYTPGGVTWEAIVPLSGTT